MLRCSVILILGCATAGAFLQETSATADSQRRADVYAIYSLMMTDPTTSHGHDNNEIYLIRDTTVPGAPREPCVRVPPRYMHDFDEVFADYNRRKDTPATLQRALTIAKSYELLNSDEIKEFIDSHRNRPGPRTKPKELFQRATDLFGLTDVFFNQSRTLALTGISIYCGDLCGSYTWKVFEKNRGHWEERPWITCSMMSSVRRETAGRRP
jgi:hypothetical protein